RINGKIPPGQVGHQVRGEFDPIGAATVTIVAFPAKGGNLQLLITDQHSYRAKLFPQSNCAGKEGLYFLRTGIRGNIPVLRHRTTQQVTGGAPNQIGLVATVVQPPQDGKNLLWNPPANPGPHSPPQHGTDLPSRPPKQSCLAFLL